MADLDDIVEIIAGGVEMSDLFRSTNVYYPTGPSQPMSEVGRTEQPEQQRKTDAMELGMRLDRIALICQAMWELLREHTGMSDEDVMQKMAEIDLRDGKEDGKMRHKVVTCPNCKRPANTRMARCWFCGQEFKREHLFE
ncbi:hypothetical protein JXA32_09280 [Candidatus Sumerlaeota bacterium]|nr:hypothetical protein [Candidatus Sumerlaeota bacterium]